MAEIRVRQPTSGDGPAIARAHVRAWRAGYADLMPATLLDRLDENERGDAWEQRLIAQGRAGSEEGVEFLAADLATSHSGAPDHPAFELVGIATIGPYRPDGDGSDSGEDPGSQLGEIWMINVRPDGWGRGVGTALLTAASDRLVTRGFHDQVLWVLDGNERARVFYERRGWWVDGETKTEVFDDCALTEVRYRRRR